jgi:Ser/Thr protein kinase RdoA (MazF antagonist)
VGIEFPVGGKIQKINEEQIRPLDGFESFMYEFQRDGNGYILRIGHSLRRSPDMIWGEVDWINYLAAGGAGVSRAITSADGNLVEVVDDGSGGAFLATAFEKAEGRPAWEVGWNTGLYENYGTLLGGMHALSKGYRPGVDSCTRPQWDDHIDEHGTITLFDFDDCNYSWYINDIAIVLFYKAMGADHTTEHAQEFMTHFLTGYRRENYLDPLWLKEIPYFLKLREIDLYAIIHRSFDVHNLDDPWVARYMEGRRQLIEDGVPYLDFDFESLDVYM